MSSVAAGTVPSAFEQVEGSPGSEFGVFGTDREVVRIQGIMRHCRASRTEFGILVKAQCFVTRGVLEQRDGGDVGLRNEMLGADRIVTVRKGQSQCRVGERVAPTCSWRTPRETRCASPRRPQPGTDRVVTWGLTPLPQIAVRCRISELSVDVYFPRHHGRTIPSVSDNTGPKRKPTHCAGTVVRRRVASL